MLNKIREFLKYEIANNLLKNCLVKLKDRRSKRKGE